MKPNSNSVASQTQDSRIFDATMLAILVAAAACFSILFLSNQSLRLDEAQSLWQTSRTPLKILNIIGQDVHVPGYHLLLHLWIVFFGNSVLAGRLFSLIFFLLTIPAIYWLGRITFGRKIGLFAATIFTISPFINWYGSEIRMYSLLTLATVLNQIFFIKIYKENAQSSWIFYGITAFVGIYTHYFFWLILLSQGIFFGLRREMFSRQALRNFGIILALLLAAFSPWLWYVQSLGSASNTQPALSKPTTVNLVDTFVQFLFGFQNDRINTGIASLWPLTVLLGFLSLRKQKSSTNDNLYFFLSFLIPVAAAFLLSVAFRPVFLSRYLIIVVPSLYLFLCAAVFSYPKLLSRIFRVGAIAVFLLTLTYQTLSASTPVKEDYREAVDYLSQNATPQDVIVVSAPFTVYPVEYYYRGSTQITTLPLWDRFGPNGIPPFSEDTLESDVEKIKGSHSRLWLLLSYDQGYEDKLRMYFDSRYHRFEEVTFSPGMTLYGYQLRYDLPAFNNQHANAGSSWRE